MNYNEYFSKLVKFPDRVFNDNKYTFVGGRNMGKTAYVGLKRFNVMGEDLNDEGPFIMLELLAESREVIERKLALRYGPPVNGKYIDSIGRAFWVEKINVEESEGK